MGQALKLWDGDEITCKANAALTGGRGVAVVANRGTDGLIVVGPPSAAGTIFGVAAHDAASGDYVLVYHAQDIICSMQASATGCTAGTALKVDATGQVIPQGGTGLIIGYAVEDIANGGLGGVSRTGV